MHGNGNEWDPTVPMGMGMMVNVYRGKGMGIMGIKHGNGNSTMGVGMISHCICPPQPQTRIMLYSN